MKTSISAQSWCSLALVATLASAVLIPLAPSSAEASGIQRHATTGFMYRQVFLLKAGVNYTFSTRNLSAGSDTILHVLHYPDGQFISGNDDTVTIDPENGAQTIQPFSTVGIAPASTDRTVYLVVRGKPGTPDGTANFNILGTTNTGLVTVKNTTTSIQFSAGFVKTVPSLAAGTHLTTVEEPIGTQDTVLMVVGSDPATTVAFDDDDAIDRMSFARLTAACSNCQIVVGTPRPSIHTGFLNITVPSGPMTVIWDETIEITGHDVDRDGLSTELEALLFTDPTRPDSDFDGIDDGFETFGGQLAGGGRNPPPSGGGKDGNLLKFPKYGANPIVPDVFVEVDWVPACPASDPTCCRNGSCLPTQIDADSKRSVPDQLLQAASAMRSGAVVHFDVGLPTAPADPNVTFGIWGGAGRIADGEVTYTDSQSKDGFGNIIYNVTMNDSVLSGFDVDCFEGVVPARVGFFHHVIISDTHAKGRLPELGTTLFESAACAVVSADGMTIAHELGHNFNLHHGGFPVSGGDINCKLNYGSIMNYASSDPGADPRNNPFAPGYSIGRFVPRVLNGMAMSESGGLGTSDPGILGVFNNGAPGAGGDAVARGFSNPGAFPTGIDWNMDGRIDGSVRAPATWGNNGPCGTPYLRGEWNISSGVGVGFPTLDIATASSARPEIFVLAQGVISSGKADVASCNPSVPIDCSNWTDRYTYLSNPRSPTGIQSGLAVAGPLALYNRSGGLAYQRFPFTRAVAQPAFVGPSIKGEPAAIETNGRVRVYYVKPNGRLAHSEYDEATNTWPYFAEEFWEDGTPVNSGLGIALAHGAVRPGGQGIFAAIPNQDGVPAGKPLPIEFAQFTSTTEIVTTTVPSHVTSFRGQAITVPAYTYSFPLRMDRWQRFAGATRPASNQFAKPGLTYAPFDLAVPNDGRFYLTYLPGTGFGPRTARMIFTEGNDTSAGATSRRLIWKTNQSTWFADDDNQSRDFGTGVVLARFGASVAAAATDFRGFSNFFPAADGIVNIDVHDTADNQLVQQNLRCSVHGDRCDDTP
jgi:hypothetical protein